MHVFSTHTTYAVVGASDNPEKFGHKVFMHLHGVGEDVAPIHLGGGTIAGVTRYKKLSDMPTVPHTVVTVVPPVVTETIVRECAELGVSRVWMQPGSESEAAVQYCKDHGMDVVTNACIMVRG